MEDETRQALSESLENELFAGIEVPSSPAEVRRMQDQFGKENLTAWLAGTTDKGSRAWKSARDGLSRRRSGRGGIGKLWRDKFRTAGRRARSSGIRSRGSLHVKLTADITTSRTTDYGRTMEADLTGSALEDYLDAIESGNYEQAAMINADAYGIDPDIIIGLQNISGFDTDAPEPDEDEEE